MHLKKSLDIFNENDDDLVDRIKSKEKNCMKINSIKEKDKNNDITQRRGKDKEKGISVQNIIILRNKKIKGKKENNLNLLNNYNLN